VSETRKLSDFAAYSRG